MPDPVFVGIATWVVVINLWIIGRNTVRPAIVWHVYSAAALIGLQVGLAWWRFA